VHVVADSKSGVVRSASVTPVNVDESQQLDKLPTGDETRLYGDSAYNREKDALKTNDPKACDFTNKRAYRNRLLSEQNKETNQRKFSVRTKVEYPFLGPKRLWGFAKANRLPCGNCANRLYTWDAS
jgi:IS5 family transposase